MTLRELGAAEEARQYFEKFGQLRSSMTASVRAEKAAMTDQDFMRRAIVEMATKAGAVYAMHGDLAEAGKCWTRATTLDPTNVECREMLCRLRPNDAGQWLRLGHLYIQDGRPGQAEMPFQRVIELAPQRAEGYAALAEVCVRLGKDAEKAVQLARTAVQLESTASNYFVLAAACERVEDWSGAESALTHAIELDPAEPRYREAHARLQKVRQP
jgi:cytochrome c-type biogenesis protein CcmH/NrfG